MDLYGFKVYTLIGGYKKFRNYVLDTFKLPLQFKILGGYTGSGKTEVLRSLRQRGENVVDLEEIAIHKGSAFGNIGMPQQPTQEMFENVLASELREISKASPPVGGGGLEGAWLEDESQRIGNVNIPTDIWSTMRRSPVYFLDIPFEERLKHLVEEYGTLDKEKMISAIGRIREKLGGLNAKNASLYIEEGNIEAGFSILLKYYDKYYLKALHNREGLNSLLTTINCEFVTPENTGKLTGLLQYQHENHYP
jgi:tRNA 2-selenouridine synthase